jgi:4-amino-4-deoxy-L-arabinose transferase-like glycosyltransferase
MMLALCATLALASFDRMRFEQRWRWLPCFALALTGAILAKATAALLLVGLPIGLQLALDGSWRTTTGRRVLAGAALGCATGFLWYAVMLSTIPGAAETFVSEALLPVGIRGLGAGSARHYGLPTDYLVPLLLGALPASAFLPLAIRRCIESRLYAGDPRRRFVALSFLSLLIALALIPQKQRHYLLPLLPLLALLLAEALVDLRARSPGRLRANLRWLAGLITPLGLAGLVALGCFYGDFLGMPAARRIPLVIAGAALLSGLLWSAQRARPRAFAVLSAAASLALMLVWFGSINIWRSRLEDGTAISHPAYEAARWQRASREHPLIARFLQPYRRGG